MKKGLFIFTIGALVLTGCSSNDGFDQAPEPKDETKDAVADNVKSIFGVTFDPNQDWCTTTSGTVTISGIPSGATSVQLFALISKEVKNDDNQTETETSLLKLNEATNVGSTVNLIYDAPRDHQAIYAAAVVNGYRMMKQVKNGVADFSSKQNAAARRAAAAPAYETMKLFADSTFESYASQRGWVPGQKVYGMSGEAYEAWKQAAEPYSTEYTQLLRDLIFSYFKNGRDYNNLPLVMESKLVNDKVYPVTTGNLPIIISPVYKRDGAKQWGNEVLNSDLYYYYFKEEALTDYVEKGGNAVDFLNALPRYKAIPFNQHFGSTEDDKIDKRFSYTLIYWGDGEPDYDRVGQAFPAGYKIGFMVRAKTQHKENGKARKQGELYGDGRLNNDINNYSECNFTSSHLPTDGPRACWLNVEDRLFLTFESGTDRDFNDIILEVEGGIDPISFIPEFERDYYTFCFEDRELGDYDMNDVVIRATRINKTTVEYSIVACGAYDELQVKNIAGAQVITGDKEIHSLFGVPTNTFINTVKGATPYEPVTEQVTVPEKFSFLNAATQPYIHNVTMNKDVKLSQRGEDPHGIMIPYAFRWPKEKTCIKDAYLRFNEWGQDSRINSTDWYKYPVEENVY